jgi:hypothetical protein
MTDLLDLLHDADPARGIMPTLPFDDVRDRYVTAPTLRRRRLVPLAAAAAVVAALAVGVAVRRTSTPSPLRAGKPPVTIPANLLAEAMAVAPEEQRVALADGYVSADELGVAGEAMAACMTASGSGAPREWEDLGNGARLPNKGDDGDDACERTHTLWLGWAFRVQVTLAGSEWANTVASVFMNPDATAEQIAAVDALLHRLFPNGTIRFVDKLEARRELATLFPDQLPHRRGGRSHAARRGKTPAGYATRSDTPRCADTSANRSVQR